MSDLAANREQQRVLYGTTFADVVHGLTTRLFITQARLATVLGVSPAMLSQLVSAQRITIRDPSVVHRLRLLVQRADVLAGTPVDLEARDEMLTDVARLRWGFPESQHG